MRFFSLAMAVIYFVPSIYSSRYPNIKINISGFCFPRPYNMNLFMNKAVQQRTAS
jgi:hypothetical protein